MRAASLVVIGSALLAAIGGCGDALSPNDELSAARRRWAQRAPEAYTVVLSRSCECTAEMAGPVRLEIRNSAVVSRSYVVNGAAVPSGFHDNFPDVNGLFALIADVLRQDPHRLEVRYDPTLGYPLLIAVDFDAVVADDEFSYSVTDLRPLVTLED